jgi:hypothetical protein
MNINNANFGAPDDAVESAMIPTGWKHAAERRHSRCDERAASPLAIYQFKCPRTDSTSRFLKYDVPTP